MQFTFHVVYLFCVCGIPYGEQQKEIPLGPLHKLKGREAAAWRNSMRL